jgi:putative hydrolase of the HAD superfamily
MIRDIDAIAFDIDGTLYPNRSLYRLLGPFLLKNARFFAEFGEVRREIRLWQEAHPGEVHEDFFAWQADLLAARIGSTAEAVRTRLDETVYFGWKPLFGRIKPFPDVEAAFAAFRSAGLKIGILSDFLPAQKGELWGLLPLCDVVLGSEETGALKPSPVPFRTLAAKLGLPPERVLYVGNSVKSDVRGAAAVGMKTACIVGPVARAFGRAPREADISFVSYRQLTRIVLN